MTEAELIRKLEKDKHHDHYWIQDGKLYESYQTIRGLRYRFIMEVEGLPEMDKVDDECLIFIQKEYSV